MAGPTYVAAGVLPDDDYSTSPGSKKITFTLPAAAQAGDTAAVLIRAAAGSSVTAPGGWTSHGSIDRQFLFSKLVASGETSYQFTSADNLSGGAYYIARGADPTTPVAVVGTGYNGTGTSHVFPGLTTPKANCLAVILALGTYNGAASFTAPGGMTERLDSSVHAFASTTLYADADELAVAAAGAVADKTLTSSASMSAMSGFMLAFQPPDAPTVTGVSPLGGGTLGGTAITITGTNFIAGATVDIGGSAATSVVVVSSTQITCVTPSGTAGAKTVTVTTSAGDGALASGYSYASVVDANVKLYRGGSFVGNDQADTATQWPSTAAYREYGGAADMWGTTLTPAQVNASDFGVGIAATVGAGGEARISHVEMEIYYSVPGVQDPQSYLSVLKVNAARDTLYPAIYQLPRAGFTIANDPSISRAVSDADLYTSRIYEPARYIEKTYRAVEFYAELSPETGTPGFQVWASIENGSFFQLLDSSGAAATIRTSGPQRLFFPPSDVARGKWVQFKLRVPTLSGDQVAVDVAISNFVIRVNYRPERTDTHTFPLILGTLPAGRGHGSGNERRTAFQKLQKLIDLAGPGRPPVTMRDALGRDIYAHIVGLDFEEVMFRDAEEPTLVAFVSYRQVEYA